MLDGYNFLTQDQNNDSSSNYNNNHNHRALITMTMLKLISIHQKQQRVREYHKLIAASYRLLGLISYLTSGEDETRAWTIKIGTKAPQAAGKIHSDFERGFIKAEVVNYKDLLEQGSLAAAREKGLVGMEGKEYIVRDGDVILFRFNV